MKITQSDNPPSSTRPIRLEKANIIPTILDPFTPLLTLNVTWKKATAELGNSVKPKKAKKQPSIDLFDVVPSGTRSVNNDKIQLTIALTDPDAPSAQDPEWSQMCHWIATDAKLSPAGDEDEFTSSSLTDILPYKPPGPPPSTGPHRYIFVALAPLNGTTERLNLSVPGSRKRWGFEGERAGLREWARENGLGVVGEFSQVSFVLILFFHLIGPGESFVC